MPCLIFVNSGTRPDSWLCSRWHAAWCYTVTWLLGIDIVWGVVNIGLIIRASLLSPGTLWGIGLS